MKSFIKLLLLTLVATLSFQYGAAQTPMPKEPVDGSATTFKQIKVKEPRIVKRNKAPNRDVVQKTVVACNGTNTSVYAPVYGSYFDYGTVTQMVYPASKLKDNNAELVDGDVITALTFHSNASINSAITSTPVTVYIGNTNVTEVAQSGEAIEKNLVVEQMEKVYEGNLSANGSTVTITFTSGFEYEGNNLILDIRTDGNGSSYKKTYWYGQSSTANSFASLYYDSGWYIVSSSYTSFLPKMTITFNHNETPYLAKLKGNGDFGIVNSGESATRTFTVTNRGTSSFTPHLESSNAAFTISGDMSTPLEAGGSRDFQVKFTAGVVGNYTGTLSLSATESTEITGTETLHGKSSIATNVADGTDTGDEVPIWGYTYDEISTRGQMIYPESMLGEVAGKQIKSITFYPESMIVFDGGTISVEMGTTTTSSSYASASSSAVTLSGTTRTGSVNPAQGDGSMTINLTQPLEYTSGNLVINTQVSAIGDYGSTSWLGTTTDNYQSYYYAEGTWGGSGCLQFLPKITFEFVPIISVDETALDFGDVAENTTSEPKVVTVTNQTTNNVNLSWTFSPENGPFGTTATASTVQAGTEVEIPVTFTPTANGPQTGTLTITAGDKTFTVTLSGKGATAYAADIDKQTIDFGRVAVNGKVTATVTLTNMGLYDINPSYTDPAEPFAVTGVVGSLASDESRTYTISLAPEAEGEYSGSFTIADEAHGISYVVNLTGVAVKLDTIKPSPVVLDFGTVNKGSTKPLTVTYTNPNSEQVAVTLTPTAGYTVSPASFNLAANGTQTVTVTFAPTAAQSYYGTLTANAAGLDTIVVLKGIGRVEGSPAAIRDEAFFEGISYTWPITTNANTSTLAEIATDPDQIIAMLRKVYMDRTIPGNYHRGYSSTGGSETNDVVTYTGVGRVTSSSTTAAIEDSYGWDIPGNVIRSSSNSSTYYMDPEQYKPYDEGVTLLLLEIEDGFDPSTDFTYSGVTADYNKLRDYIAMSIKSARIITEAKRVGNENDQYSSGTLFKIDCDKMNKFFFMAKGQLSWHQESDTHYNYPHRYNDTYYDRGLGSSYLDKEPALFCHMFEQLSPAEGNSEAPISDAYQKFVTEMESYPINHDCPNVPFVLGKGHYFMMYGQDSESSDCQDIRDMMFFLPDYRMMYWSGRTAGSYQDYFYYNKQHLPSIGVFVIQQDEITDAAQVQGKKLYKHSLKWKSNLDKYLPGEEQEYELWEIVVDEFGMESYVPVYYRNANGQYTDANGTVVSKPVPIVLDRVNLSEFSYPNVYVDMKEGSQTKTYVIRGRDKDHFLSLQMSNFQEVFIPGTDPNEKARMIGATYYSRFNAEKQTNCYSNRLELSNNGMTLTAADLSNGLKFYRSSRAVLTDENGDIIPDANGNVQYKEVNKELIATATATATASGGTLTIVLDHQSDSTLYPKASSNNIVAGYHKNTKLSYDYTIRNGVVQFTGNTNFLFWDNFVVDVSKNAHPLQYLYKMEAEGAGVNSTVILDVTDCSPGADVAWYAWTWPEGGDGEWVEGIDQGDNKFKFTGIPVNNKFFIVRMNANYDGGVPNWGAEWNRTPTYTVDGSTLTIGWYTDNSGNIWNSWTGAVDATAYSNEVRVPVYKTDSKINGSFTKEEVDAETGNVPTIGVDKNIEFSEVVQLSSKSEILRYDVYRWGAEDDHTIIYYVDPKDKENETDEAPDGMAGNQGDWYTVSMNKDTDAQNYYVATGDDLPAVSTSNPTNWAKFVDSWPGNQGVADEYTYAPVVELFTKGYKTGTTTKRKDYNTYGGPLKNSATGKFTLAEPNNEASKYTWPGNKNQPQYCYYDVYLKFNAAAVPSGYKLYKVRVWRQAPTEYLGEEDPLHENRMGTALNDGSGLSSFKYEEITYGEDDECDVNAIGNYTLGEKGLDAAHISDADVNVYRYTFGARKVGTESTSIPKLPLKFIVRAYYTNESNLTRAGGDDKFYIVEQEIDYTIDKDNIITEVRDLSVDKQVVGVTYVNSIGQMSSTPWQGVNIIVTRYSDGSTTTKKVIK